MAVCANTIQVTNEMIPRHNKEHDLSLRLCVISARQINLRNFPFELNSISGHKKCKRQLEIPQGICSYDANQLGQ